jgi:hypothetical protein
MIDPLYNTTSPFQETRLRRIANLPPEEKASRQEKIFLKTPLQFPTQFYIFVLQITGFLGIQFLPYLLIFPEKNHGILAGEYQSAD